jgi:hypothetical protein
MTLAAPSLGFGFFADDYWMLDALDGRADLANPMPLPWSAGPMEIFW